MAIVYLGLGSNLGNRVKNIESAIDELKHVGIEIIISSSIIETEPEGGPVQGKYLNAVLKCKTNISPEDLLKEIKIIEKKLGRIKTVINGPRTIDIDILLYDNLKINLKDLIIPHPRMKNRIFVIDPLKEIEPELVKELLNESHR